LPPPCFFFRNDPTGPPPSPRFRLWRSADSLMEEKPMVPPLMSLLRHFLFFLTRRRSFFLLFSSSSVLRLALPHLCPAIFRPPGSRCHLFPFFCFFFFSGIRQVVFPHLSGRGLVSPPKRVGPPKLPFPFFCFVQSVLRRPSFFSAFQPSNFLRTTFSQTCFLCVR